MTTYKISFYYRNEFMEDFVLRTQKLRALTNESAVDKMIRNMKKKAGNNGEFKSESIKRIS